MALLTKVGYGQVEPNHLSAQRTAQIYAQLPADPAITVLENGAFLKYDMAAGECNADGDGEFMLVYNEIKLYDQSSQSVKDFALTGTGMVPRLFKTNVGDIFTTNYIDTTVADTVAVGNLFEPVDAGTVGVLTQVVSATAGAITFKVVKVTTMPDGQKAVKLQRIA